MKQGTVPRLVLAGDIAIETADPALVMGKVAEYFQKSSIAFCNCEWPLTDRGQPWPGKAGRVVRSAPDLVRATLAASLLGRRGNEAALEVILERADTRLIEEYASGASGAGRSGSRWRSVHK